MIESYKCLHGIDKIPTHFLPLGEDRRTVGHTLKFKKVRNNTNRRRMFYSQCIVDEWNSLSEEVVKSPTLNCFKNRLDKFRSKKKYSETDISYTSI